MNYLTEHGSCLSKELKAFGNYRKGGNTGFETVITRLQMQTYITVQTFENQIDKNGNEYGWGIARYVVSEDWLGKNNCRGAYRERPEDSFERILEHMQKRIFFFPIRMRKASVLKKKRIFFRAKKQVLQKQNFAQ